MSGSSSFMSFSLVLLWFFFVIVVVYVIFGPLHSLALSLGIIGNCTDIKLVDYKYCFKMSR